MQYTLDKPFYDVILVEHRSHWLFEQIWEHFPMIESKLKWENGDMEVDSSFILSNEKPIILDVFNGDFR